MKRQRRRETDGERLDDDAPEKTERMAAPPTLEALTALASGGAVLSRRGVADLQRLAGNRATQSLIETKGAAPILQRQPEAKPGSGVESANEPAPSAPEEAWDGSIKGYLGDNLSVYHTLNNFGDQQLDYLLRIHSTGYAMLSLETQHEYKTGPDRAWTVLSAQRGETLETTTGLAPHSSVHLRLFGERDFTQKDQSYFEGTVEVRRRK